MQRFVKNHLVAVFVLVFPVLTCAQKWLAEPTIRICERIIECDDERHIELSNTEVQYLESLLKSVPAKSSPRKVERYFKSPPYAKSPSTEIEVSKRKRLSFRATWLVESNAESERDSHVDVYFLDGEAFMLKWWSDKMSKMVQINYAK
jgi:hypothetical protein